MFSYEIKNFIDKRLRRKVFKPGQFIKYDKETKAWHLYYCNDTEVKYPPEDIFLYDDFEEFIPLNISLTISNSIDNPYAIIDQEGNIIAKILGLSSIKEIKEEVCLTKSARKDEQIKKETKNLEQQVSGTKYKCISCEKRFDKFNVKSIGDARYYYCPYLDCNELLFDSATEEDDLIRMGYLPPKKG